MSVLTVYVYYWGVNHKWSTHKVRTYKEYHSVRPSSELGLSQSLSRQRVFPSPQKQGGGGTLACGWGVGGESQFRRGAYTVVLFICTYFVGAPVLGIRGKFPPLPPPTPPTLFPQIPTDFSSWQSLYM
jgi:hypothetical protein